MKNCICILKLFSNIISKLLLKRRECSEVQQETKPESGKRTWKDLEPVVSVKIQPLKVEFREN